MTPADLDRIASGLGSALVATASAAAMLRDPWWVIGSAALALHGVDPGGVGDIDLLTSADDARILLTHAAVQIATGSGDGRFRSAVHGGWREGTFTIDVMGDLAIAEATGWRRLEPATREAIALADVSVFVPARAELIEILTRFGRPKDFLRRERLRQVGGKL